MKEIICILLLRVQQKLDDPYIDKFSYNQFKSIKKNLQQIIQALVIIGRVSRIDLAVRRCDLTI